ncbi:UDP-N-acetylmuramate--L-alanine ligase [Patescibacteria group bacterium]|nr:UDP-N-acetylmuramate--L-alanine ligase [Patescibacteria group bacterium]
MKLRAHFIGIGGIGVSALARYFLAQNWAVSGSDIEESIITKELRREGAQLKIGHFKSNVNPDIAIVIYSQAVPLDNPELIEAERLNIPISSYPEALGALTRENKTVAVAGSHGKSTITALTARVLISGGFDPTVIVGTRLKEFGNSNFRAGRNGYLVIEADEYREAFQNYQPDIIVLNNIDREHLDYYKNLRNAQKAFVKFVNNMKGGGIVIANADDQSIRAIRTELPKDTIWFSLDSKTNAKRVKQIKRVIKIYGSFNVSNALAAYLVGEALGITDDNILDAIGGYRGAWRRMEYRGKAKIGKQIIEVYDDYAHHPTEIVATLGAFREHFPKSHLICIFQPHQLQRLKALFQEFRESFNGVNSLILIDAYQVAGRDNMSHNVSSAKLARAIAKSNKDIDNVVYLPSQQNIKGLLSGVASKKKSKQNIAVMMGAGDIVKLTDRLLQ